MHFARQQSTMEAVHTMAQVGKWKSQTYMDVYRRATNEAKVNAMAKIGSHMLGERLTEYDMATSHHIRKDLDNSIMLKPTSRSF